MAETLAEQLRITDARDKGAPTPSLPRPAGTAARKRTRRPSGPGPEQPTLGLATREGTLRPPMEKFVIEGGRPLAGTITPAGNKNGALPILAACLLTDDEVILRNVPRISDVEAMMRLLQMLGARVEWLGSSEVLVDTSSVETTQVDRSLAERIRASFLLAGPLLARFGSARMPPPGGAVIGRRRLDPHLDAFRELGATVDCQHDEITLTAPALGLHPCDFLM